MTRGNQRDLARAKNLKKGQGSKAASDQAGNAGTTMASRMDRDAEAMRIKQAKAAEKKAADDAAKAAQGAKVTKFDPLK